MTPQWPPTSRIWNSGTWRLCHAAIDPGQQSGKVHTWRARAHTHTHTHTKAYYDQQKIRYFASRIGWRWSSIKAWATTVVAPLSVRSMTTKEQMKQTFRGKFNGVPGSPRQERTANWCVEHTIVSRILPDLIFSSNHRSGAALSTPTIESAKQSSSSNAF